MDEWLAQIYGTDGGSDDLEKTAQAVLLEKLAEEEGIDLSQFSDEELQALANDVVEAEGSEEEASEEDEEELSKEAQAKFEEADFLGRVMAHSYNQELEKIAKNKEAQGKIEEVGRKYVTEPAGKAGKYVGQKTWAGMKAVGRGGKAVGRGAKAVGRFAAKHRGKGALGGLAAAGGYGTYKAVKSRKTKTAFDKLAEIRAQEILNDSEKEDTSFEDSVNERALEMLQEAGYDVK